MRLLALLLLLLPLVARAAEPAATRPANVDPAAWQRMLDIDAKAAQVQDLVADFEQQKFTAMLKKPLVSRGVVKVRGNAMLWDTKEPEPTQLQIDAREVRIYYPEQKTIEAYQVREKLGQLAASPLPRLDVLREHFSFEPIAVGELGEKDDLRFFAVRMTPTDPELREHVDQVRVLLDAKQGLILRLEMRDADGDRTLIAFANVKTNTGMSETDLRIAAPPDVKVTRPLAAVEGDATKDAK
jgi:outer membrane lipoprotein-sorting protein